VCIRATDTCGAIVRAYKTIYPPNHPLLGLQVSSIVHTQQIEKERGRERHTYV
jgi:hypothetical protein